MEGQRLMIYEDAVIVFLGPARHDCKKNHKHPVKTVYLRYSEVQYNMILQKRIL